MKLAYLAVFWIVAGGVVPGFAKKSLPTIRWNENARNCAFRELDDGHVVYDLSAPDFDVALTLDPQELAKVARRALPFLAVSASFHYKGQNELKVQQDKFTLEFVKHHRIVQNSLDPDDMIQTMLEHAVDMTDEVEHHQVRKHPDQKEQQETELKARLQDYGDMARFLQTHTLHTTVLTPAQSSVSGWVLFSTKNRWIGPWHKPEEFVLRVPVEGIVVEFPFELPPRTAKILLRRR